MEQQMVWEPLPFDGAAQQQADNPNMESQLIHAAQRGDLSAFNQLVLEYQDRLYGWTVSLVRDEMLAEDITQWTFVTAYQKLDSFRGGSFRAWLFRIARNRSFDELRLQKRYASSSLENTADEDSDRLDRLPGGDPLPEDVVMSAQQAVMIDDLLNHLPDVFQQVLRLIDMEGMDYQETADILNIPLGTLKSRIARARIKMRSLLEVSL